MRISRRFVDIEHAEVHLRTAGEGAALPLVMLHASPGSSKQLEPLLRALGARRRVIAPDTLGNGDSSPPPGAAPEIEVFAEAHRAALDALGVTRFDVYGTHTGANMAIELAIRYPARVRRVILDGVSNYTDAQRADMLRHHAPPITLDDQGAYLGWIWHFVRDAYLFWPWYRREAAATRRVGVPAPEVLYDKVLEVLKAARTYHLSYNAAIRYPKIERLPRITQPTLVACAQSDMLLEYLDSVAALVPGARRAVTPGTGQPERLCETVRVFEDFLDEAE